jgi:hypothetical protein
VTRPQLRWLEIRTAAGPSSAVQCVFIWWPVHHGIAGDASPDGVSAAVTETSLMSHQHLLWPESVAVRAA